MTTVKKKRLVGFKLIAVIVVVIVAAQLWGMARNASRVRAVFYNEGPGIVEDVTLACENERISLGVLADESSRYVWFRPEERSVVVKAIWNAANGHHENDWAVECGERLTVRVDSVGEPTVSRERSLGRRLLDALASD